LELEGPLDRAVRTLFGATWGAARAWIGAGKVRVGGELVTEATARVTAGERVGVDLSARRPRASELAEDAIVHVDAHLVVVSKPPGVSTVPYAGQDSPSGPREADDALDARVRAWLGRHGRGGKKVRPSLGVVHRLDKETSGLLVFARTWLAKQSLASQFRQHTVHRKYLAIAHGDVRSRTIRSHLLEDRGDGRRGSARGRADAGAREAVTHVERIETLAGATLVACRLETGRTHQIRIHLSEGGCPLVGERVYIRGWPGQPIDAPRLMLHAAELGFVHPATQREVRWQQPMPADMRVVVERLRR
jgi:23S rRNA pseudouridine1911/1915/1917 synthase